MRQLELHAKETDISTHKVLEASAGTGKTFAIEQLYIRFLLEKEYTLDQILVVTFTKAAAKELYARLYRAIETMLKSPELPEYLKGRDRLAIDRRLEEALVSFSEARIATIHSFALTTLAEEGIWIEEEAEEGGIASPFDAERVIHDFFLKSHPELLPSQLELLLAKKGREGLEKELTSDLLSGKALLPPYLLAEKERKWKEACAELVGITKESILDDFSKEAGNYNKISTREGIKPEVLEAIETFSGLFERPLDEVLLSAKAYFETFHPDNRKAVKIKKDPSVGLKLYPLLSEKLEKLVSELTDLDRVYTLFAAECQKLFTHYLRQKGKRLHEESLQELYRALQNPEFLERVRLRTRVALIDEFQDTDLLQWKLFRTLFLEDPEKRSQLFLIGDPKQSIYAFRGADIYTYQAAKAALGEENLFVLGTNYRSDPALVEATNALFEKAAFLLPKTDESLTFLPVAAGKTPTPPLDDGKAACHLFYGEEEVEILTAFVEEIDQLVGKREAKVGDFAVLVSDRFQALKVSNLLRASGIKTALHRATSLHETEIYRDLLLFGALMKQPHNQRILKPFLSSSLVGASFEELHALLNLEELAEEVDEALRYSNLAKERGFGSALQQLLQEGWRGKRTQKRLFEKSASSLTEALQILDLLLDFEARKRVGLDESLRFLKSFEELGKAGDERMQVVSEASDEAVTIITMHSSKGLEYDYVLPLGLLSPVRTEDLDEKEESFRLLYVALTRAAKRLYLPYLLSTRRESYMSFFASKWGPYDPDAVPPYLKQLEERELITTQRVEAKSLQRKEVQKTAPPLGVRPKLKKRTLPKRVGSFTALQQELGEEVPFLERELPQDEKSIHAMPMGKEVGILIHSLYEEFLHPRGVESGLLKERLAGTPLEGWEEPITTMMQETLHVPLPIKTPFTLAEVDFTKTFKEIAFMYPTEAHLPHYNGLRGVIDFVFFHEGKYFLIDWKSNWLGPSGGSYSQEAMQQALHDHHYPLQANIYREALEKYLRLFDKRPFDEIFGGAFYFFLRGVDKSGKGVIHVR